MKRLNLVVLFLAVIFAVLPLNANTCLEFAGGDDHVIVNPFSGFPESALTVSFWIKTSDTVNTGTPISYATGTSDNSLLVLDCTNIEVYIDGQTTGTSGISLNDGFWHFFTATWQSSNGALELYKDGILEYSGTVAQGSSLETSGSFVLAQEQDSVGGGFQTTQAFKGLLDEVRIWNTVRTETEINDNMFNPLTGSETGLVSYYNFNEGTSTNLGDSAGSNDGTITNMEENDWIESTCFDTFTDIGAGLTDSESGSVAWGDYDNDGDLDILLTGYNGSDISRIYRNDNGIFVDIGASLTGVTYSSVAWGDYDNDGDLDILLTGYNGSDISRIYRNDSGVFTDIGAGLEGVSSSSVAWGDYDNDGDLDILLTGYNGSGISRIYRNDSGVFTDIGAGLGGVFFSSVAWGDYDNDGDLDVLLTGQTSSGIMSRIYRNDSGVFTDIGAGLEGVSYSSVAWGDYDNDGDLDILLTGYNGSGRISKIYRNNSIIKNTIPSKPSGLVTKFENDKCLLSFNPSTDNETPQLGLSYNVSLQINGNTINSPMSDAETGYRRVAETGNLCQVTESEYAISDLSNLPQEEKSFSWRVQAVDHCFAGSEFESSLEFLFSSPRDLIITSNINMIDTDVLKWEYINPEKTDHYVIQIDDDSYFTSPFEKIYTLSKDKINNKNKEKTIYLSMPLNGFEEINEFEDQKVYYWRIKPVYSDLDKITLFSENPKDFKFVITTYYPPSSISIEATTDSVILSWNTAKELEKGEVFNVYSTNDPYAVFPAGWFYEATVSTTEWVTTASELKKFYCVTSTSSKGEDVETPIHRVSK